MDIFSAMSTKDVELTTTANGAKSYSSSGSFVLDLFSKAGALRQVSNETVEKLVRDSFLESPIYTLSTLFYIRDVTQGQGERRVFRTALSYLAQNPANYDMLVSLLPLIPQYGRWDDLFCFKDTEIYQPALEYIASQLAKDLENLKSGKTVSLCAKWVGSINGGSWSRARALDLMQVWFPSTMTVSTEIQNTLEKVYRKNIAKLRSHIKIVESSLCSKDWESINYNTVPSKASLKYRKAFYKHDQVRYKAWQQAVKEGKESYKINTGTLYPYDIVRPLLNADESVNYDPTLELAWTNLPDWVQGDPKVLVVCDTSGSMYTQENSISPIYVALSLTLYLTQRNQGYWQDKFITFSSEPTLQSVKGESLAARLTSLVSATWGYSTDIQKVFELILTSATRHKLKQEHLPDTVIIVSDMQFDVAEDSNTKTNFEAISDRFRQHEYEMPQLVFWNVAARADVPVRYNEDGVILVSGASPSIFQAVVSKKTDPMEFMLDTLTAERYKPVIEVVSKAW